MKAPVGGFGFSRRDLLKGLTAGAVASVATVLPEASPPTGTSAQGVTVFRLSSRRTNKCRACRIHHRYKVFMSQARADRGRAHPGCNCPITKQKLPSETFKRIFIDTRAIRAGVVDLRQIPR